MTELLKRYLAKSKEPVLSVILAAGVWLANEVKHAVADVSAKIEKLDARIAAIERSLGHHTASR
jgi:hypothetical protein